MIIARSITSIALVKLNVTVHAKRKLVAIVTLAEDYLFFKLNYEQIKRERDAMQLKVLLILF